MDEANAAPRAAPPRLVEPDGRVHLGWFDGPIAELNLLDAAPPHALRALHRGPLAFAERAARRFRLKRWHYTSVATADVLFACAVVDAGYVGNAFAYAVDLRTGRSHQYHALSPFGLGVTIAAHSARGLTSFDKAGWGRIVLDNDDRSARRSIAVELAPRRGRHPAPALRADFELRDDGQRPAPVVSVEQSEPSCFIYTHKCYGLPAAGSVRAGDLAADVSWQEGHAGLDYNCGYRPRVTYWNWAAGAGRSLEGQRVGFNLTAHRDWQQQRAEGDATAVDAADCALWLDGRCVKIAAVDFAYQPHDLLAPWHIRDRAGLVDLTFAPLGDRSENVNLGIVVSRFHQPYGTFSGTLRSPAGQPHRVEALLGVTEQHYARW